MKSIAIASMDHALTVMTFEEIINTYTFYDGEIISFTINFLDKSCTARLKVRRYVKKRKFNYCEIGLQFLEVNNIDISEDFRTGGNYSDITFTRTAEGRFYLSVDPYGNTGQPDERDNFVITSASLVFTSENGEAFQAL